MHGGYYRIRIRGSKTTNDVRDARHARTGRNRYGTEAQVHTAVVGYCLRTSSVVEVESGIPS
jgi:hypothetical protein